MKSMFDTSVYISFIRDRSHSSELQRRGTVKYLSAIVLMELWAGSKAKKNKEASQPTSKTLRERRAISYSGCKQLHRYGAIFRRPSNPI